jgi:hypothetical protein
MRTSQDARLTAGSFAAQPGVGADRIIGRRRRASLVGVGMFAGLCLCVPGPSATAQPDRTCTLSTVKGPYGFILNGTLVGLGPLGSVGLVTFDGAGQWSAEGTISINGSVFTASFNGTYSVNSDCTGTQVGSDGSTATFVILARGNELLVIMTNPGEVATMTMKKQFPRPLNEI